MGSAKYTPLQRFIASLVLLSGVALSLLFFRIFTTDSYRYGFMVWNLFLGLIPVGLAWWLVLRVRRHGWRQWQQIALALMWLLFLPNSFYIITDFIHLRSNYEADLLFDITLLTSFTLAGLIFGYLSIYMIHKELLLRVRERWAYGIIGVILLLSSFAICLGRYNRWNTWDVLLQPAGLLFDVSDQLLRPNFYGQTYETTATMFLLLFSTYAVIFEGIRWLHTKTP